ncbi:MAG: hypothetical protein AABY18_02145 [Candidatus Thermoplasmatota archaeon]
MTTRNTILAVLAAGLLTLTALAVPVLAKDSDENETRDHSDDRRDKAQDRREAAQEKAEHRGEQAEERCLERHANESLNDSAERDCMKVGDFAEKAFKARRAAHALLGAINATERQMARLNATEDRLEDRLAAGNLSANETERIEHRLEKIDAKQERLEHRLEALKERLAKLHEKWQAVREHVEERRRGHDDDEHEDDDEHSSSSSSSSSESLSSSSSSSSAAA